jgi:hypothetical protein
MDQPSPIVPAPAQSKTSRVIAWMILIVVALAGAYVVYARNAALWPFSSAGNPAGSQAYTNATYGLQIQFPKTWSGYYAIENMYPQWNTICFGVPYANDQRFCLLQVTVFTPSQWTNYRVDNPNVVPVTQNNRYIMVAWYSLDGGGGQYSAFQKERSAEIPSILSTFQLTPASTNLKTFTNPTGGYSFAYPSQWNAAIAPTPTGSLFGPGATGTSGIGGVDVFPNVSSIDTFMNGVAATYLNKRSITVAGITGILADVQGTNTFFGTAAMIIRNGTLYNIYVNHSSATDLALFQTLLSSFRFTK